MRQLACLLGLHRDTTRSESTRYAVLITRRCVRCGRTKTSAHWEF